MPLQDPILRKEYMKQYNLKRRKDKDFIAKKTEYKLIWEKKNQDKVKGYRQLHKNSKSMIISRWKVRGILFFDYDLLYDIYLECIYCDDCKCELNKCSRSVRCLDHDHSINEYDNVRGIVCNLCNIKRR